MFLIWNPLRMMLKIISFFPKYNRITMWNNRINKIITKSQKRKRKKKFIKKLFESQKYIDYLSRKRNDSLISNNRKMRKSSKKSRANLYSKERIMSISQC